MAKKLRVNNRARAKSASSGLGHGKRFRGGVKYSRRSQGAGMKHNFPFQPTGSHSSPANFVVLGVDPGLDETGYAVLVLSEPRGTPSFAAADFYPPVRIQEAGIIKTRTEKPLEVRLQEIYQGMRGLLAEAHPQAVVVEDLYTDYRHPRTAILMGHARASILLAAAEENIPVIQYSPTRIKKAITGNGRASKEQVQLMIQTLLRLKEPPTPDHVADALAAALCHFNQLVQE